MLACTGRSNRLWLDADIPVEGFPAYQYRILDHWDNLDDTVERGYAGPSIWGWTHPALPSARIDLYARLNRKLGINGVVLNNVNANPAILDQEYLKRVAAIADILRPHGIRVYLSVNFASPVALGGLSTADPLDPCVMAWWAGKVDEIYTLVPDFGGFLVKASSEGQPGPLDYGRSHADGANLLADALAPHGGIVMWRTFVYAPDSPDRARQAYDEFVPLDGQFRSNVSLQVKNGPVDFQPREPFNPLFGAMPATSLTPELQITMEYLGQASSLVFLAPMWEEFLKADTYLGGPGSTVASLTASDPISAIAGVANVGNSPDWCGNLFNQANWYAFGRLAWNPSLSSAQIAEEWLRITFPKPLWMREERFTQGFIEPMKEVMLTSREACVDYMTPLGLHHLFAWEHHFGPDPGCAIPGAREDWMPSYYHRAGRDGIGFDRTRETGSAAVDQYNPPLNDRFNSLEDCPRELLLWFHHVPWDYRLPSSREAGASSGASAISSATEETSASPADNTLWEELQLHYNRGVEQVRHYREVWAGMKPYVDARRFAQVSELLEKNEQDAIRWRDVCLDYFRTFAQPDN